MSTTQTKTAPRTLADRFAAKYARGVVPNALSAIGTVRRNTKVIAALALAVSTPHQGLYLYGLGHPHGGLSVVSAVFFAALIPLTIDLGILTMLTVTQTLGIAQRAKRRAMTVLAVLVVMSATVNFIADGPWQVRSLTALTTVILAAVEWVSSSIAPDFAALDTTERAVTRSAKASAAAKRGWAKRREIEALNATYEADPAPVSGIPA